MGLFNPDNKIINGINKCVDCVWLSLLWFICSLPIVTSGAATTALYYAINKNIRHDRGQPAQAFFSSFKKNFKQCTKIWIVMLLLYALLGFDYYVMKRLISLGEEIGYLYKAFPVFMIFITLWGFYIFPYIARFQNSIPETLFTTLYIAFRNLPWTLVLAVLFVGAFALIYMFPPITIAVPAMYNLFKNVILERIFTKYMSPEQQQEELERNRSFYN